MQMLMIGSCCYLFGPINSCIIQPITRIVVLLIWSTGEYKSRRLNVKAIISKWLSVFSSALSVAVHIPFSIALSVTAIKWDLQGGSVKELEVACRKRLRRHLPVMANMRREGKLLPLKFDERFYQWCCNTNGSFRSHQIWKSLWPIKKMTLHAVTYYKKANKNMVNIIDINMIDNMGGTGTKL